MPDNAVSDNRLYTGDARKRSQLRDIWKRLKKNRLAVVGMVIVILLIIIAIICEWISPYPYDYTDMTNRLQFPSAQHWMGTDNFGRDLFSRLLVGTRISLLVAACAVAISFVCGGALGYSSAYVGGKYEIVITRVLDAFMSIPTVILAIAISVALGFGVVPTAVAIGISNAPVFARVSRAAVLVVKGNEFIEAARCNGASSSRILLRHIIPNTLAPILVQISLSLANSIMVISSLSFLGCGVPPPTPEWGSILSVGREYIDSFYPFLVFPGIFISVTLISFNLFSDGLRDALDPRLK